MKIFIVGSKHFYEKIEEIKSKLEKVGHKITLPVSFDEPFAEFKFKQQGKEKHADWKQKAFVEAAQKVRDNEGILVLNFEKKKNLNYVGGATFLEMYEAYKFGKKIFLYNQIPDNILRDEIEGFNPTIINGDLSLIK